jgi:hypothetical protein
VNPTFEPEATQTGRGEAEVALLFPLPQDSPQRARVDAAQQLLFPSTPQALCQQLGLSWWTALKLYQDGWISFAPDRTPRLDEAQEAELRFVASLVAAGCDQHMLENLLGGLRKPYAYDPKRLYYDWAARRWRVLPEIGTNPEAVFADWLEALVETSDIETLSGIDELAHDALARVRSTSPAFHTVSEPFHQWHVTTDDEETRG